MKPGKFVERSRKELLNSAVHWLFIFLHRMSICVNWCIITVQCCVSCCSTAKCLRGKYTVIPSLLALLPTPLGHHGAPSWAPCATQQLPPSCVSYTWQCIHVSTTLLTHPSLTFPTSSSYVIMMRLSVFFWSWRPHLAAFPDSVWKHLQIESSFENFYILQNLGRNELWKHRQ